MLYGVNYDIDINKMKNYSTDSYTLTKGMITFIYFRHFIAVAIMYFRGEVVFLQCEDQFLFLHWGLLRNRSTP